MKLNLQLTILALTFSLLTGCGGGTASLDNSRLPEFSNLPGIANSPLQLNEEIRHTVSEQDNLVFFSLPQTDEQQNIQRLSPARIAALSTDTADEIGGDDEDDKPIDTAFDWYHKNTFTPDLIRFAESVKESDNESLYVNPEQYLGYSTYQTSIPVSFNGGPIKLSIFGVRNGAGGEEFILFDQYAGLVSGGSELNGIPSGHHTYKGYNFFRYTEHSVDPYEGYEAGRTVLQDGDFEMEVDFNAGIGTISAISGLTWLAFESKNTVPGTKLIGDITVDTTIGVFVGRDLIVTEILLEDDTQQSALRGENVQFNGR